MGWSGLNQKKNAGIGTCASLLAALLLIGGCDVGDTAEGPPRVNSVRVACTVYPLADVVRQVGGDRVSVEWTVETAQPLIGATPPPQQVSRLETASLVVSNGISEPWALAGLDDPFRARQVVRLDTLPAAQQHDPQHYLWLDPEVIAELAQQVAGQLAALDIRNERFYRSNAGEFAAAVERLLAEYAPQLQAISGQHVVALHERWTPLLAHFGIRLVAPVHSPPDRLSPADLRALRQAATEHGASVMVVGADASPAVVRQLASDTGLKVITLDALGTSAPAGRNSWIEILRYNLEQLRDAI